VRFSLALLILVAALSACGSSSSKRHDQTPTSASSSPAAASRIKRCVGLLLRNATLTAANTAAAHRYVRNTYCARFENRGWVYEDGALSISAEIWLRCRASTRGEPSQNVSCATDQVGGVQTLDCALLHDVRRNEVRAYLDLLQKTGPVKCDDGAALEDLGVP
jgi:hypothetical protein